MILVMRAQSWENITANGLSIKVAPEMGWRYLPVFLTLEEAKEHFPDGPFAEIQEARE